VIIVTGHVEQIEGVRLRQLGARALLAKPLDLVELCSPVENDHEKKN